MRSNADVVRRIVSQLLPDGRPDVRSVARTVRVSTRTLQRRLSEEGFTFAGLVDLTRFDVAQRMLEDPARKVIDVALDLGYSDPAHFTRAFVRWTGLAGNDTAYTPPEYSRRTEDVVALAQQLSGSVCREDNGWVGRSAGPPASAQMRKRYEMQGRTAWVGIVLGGLVLPWCTGCPQMMITTAATTAASSLVDDRSFAQQGADLDLKARIEQQLLADSPKLASSINVDVYRGRVMLTGVVPRWTDRRNAAVIASNVAAGGGLGDMAGNFAINKELGVNLLAAQGIASQSFQHRVVNGTAFIMGQATTPGQVETARQVALQTPGVHDVVTHIVVGP